MPDCFRLPPSWLMMAGSSMSPEKLRSEQFMVDLVVPNRSWKMSCRLHKFSLGIANKERRVDDGNG
ncbi:hypothetical protein HanXRQr2_Chr11g0510631 [Helianthus annuus]|uniref:Uncharacterized protein n=1 Tax=Helianthus annuus TaxID=4232 RepID=A0A9K3HS64_HELAN|nr:hypothetical protein HanXRQr2_Chr11g0510631 [Helianthus annuus]KAJ0876736.1 hypothetical protein HanPSC8_Chr11g0491871 [Helianthus annuus]